MTVAIVGSRSMNFDIPKRCIPKETTRIVSGGSRGIDTKAREYAYKNGIQIVEIVPDYDKYARAAPIIRNKIIVAKSDLVVAFWDGKSRGTKFVIDYCIENDKPVHVYSTDEFLCEQITLDGFSHSVEVRQLTADDFSKEDSSK